MSVEAVDEFLTLRVIDNGVGVGAGIRPGGRGIANVTARARELAGEATIGDATPGGTEVVWRVPGRRG